MSRVETIVSPFPAGSARKMDYTWPDWNANNTGAVTNQIRDRPGAQAANPAGSVAPGTTGTVNVGVINGVSCVRLANGANLNQGPVCVVDGAGRLHLSTLLANVKFSAQTDDYAIHRVYAFMRVAATPTDATDCGLEIICSNNASDGVLRNAVPGWSLQLDTTGGTSLVQHGNSGAQTSTLLKSAAQGFVNTDFHKFEFQFVNATSLRNGFMLVLLDDVVMLTRSFGVVGDDLPVPTSPGANITNGYVVNLHNQGRNAELDVAYVRVQRGPTLPAVI